MSENVHVCLRLRLNLNLNLNLSLKPLISPCYTVTVFESNISARPEQAVPPDPPDLSVVIVSWNVRDLLVRCIQALHDEAVRDGLRVQIIVVDNNSTDGSAQAVRCFPSVELIQTGRNLGYGRANNIGLRAARGRHLLVLNPDTVPHPGSLKALVEFAQRHPRAGIVAPRLLNADGTVQPNAFRFPTLAMALLDLFPLPWFVPGRVRARLYRSRLNGRYPQEETAHRPFRIDHPLGACMLINRRAYEQAGGFDHALFMYSEEVDLALRYRKAGWQCWQVPQAVVTHFGGQSTRQLPDRMFVELWRSRLYVYARHYSRTSQALLRLILALAQLRDLAFTLLLYALGRIGPHEAQRRVRRASAVLRLVRWR